VKSLSTIHSSVTNNNSPVATSTTPYSPMYTKNSNYRVQNGSHTMLTLQLFTQTSQSTARGTSRYNCYLNSTLCFTQQCKHKTGLNYSSTTALHSCKTTSTQASTSLSTGQTHSPNTLVLQSCCLTQDSLYSLPDQRQGLHT